MKKHIINLAKKPFCPNGFKIEEHIKGEKNFEWDASKVELFVSKKQKNGYQKGTELRKEIKNPFNANLLDYLLAHPELIPEEWKDKVVCFWGTIYRDSDGYFCVRCLYWDGESWGRYYGWLHGDFDGVSPAARRANSSETLETLPSELIINGIKYVKSYEKN